MVRGVVIKVVGCMGKNKYDRNYTQKTMCNIHITKKNHNDVDKIYDEMINMN